jgi:hypothetical protein
MDQGRLPDKTIRPGYFRDQRFPINQGLANRGRQALPANQAGIQRRNQGPNDQQSEPNTVYIQVARSSLCDETNGSGYGYAMDLNEQNLEEMNLSQITVEELAQMQEEEAFRIEEEEASQQEDDEGSSIHHQDLDEI